MRLWIKIKCMFTRGPLPCEEPSPHTVVSELKQVNKKLESIKSTLQSIERQDDPLSNLLADMGRNNQRREH